MSKSDDSPSAAPKEWQLAPGMTRGLWEYVNSTHVAEDYDNYFANNQLFELDENVLARHFTKPGGLVADLGCGTARALVPLVRSGMRGLAVDLSEKMLQVVRRKADAEDLPIECLLANLVEFDCVADESIDYAMCLFSTLGMIRGRENRRRVLEAVVRTLKPGGRFVMHVHNRWFNLFDPSGPWRELSNWMQAIYRSDLEPGDRYFDYRGVKKMFLHAFSRRELIGELRRAGFQMRELIYLHPTRMRALSHSWFFGSLRANGWIAVCEKPAV